MTDKNQFPTIAIISFKHKLDFGGMKHNSVELYDFNDILYGFIHCNEYASNKLSRLCFLSNLEYKISAFKLFFFVQLSTFNEVLKYIRLLRVFSNNSYYNICNENDIIDFLK